MLFQPDQGQQLVDHSLYLGLVPAMQAKCDIFAYCQVWEEGIVLKDHTDLAFFPGLGLAGCAQAGAVEPNLAGINILKAGDSPQSSSFAATAGAKEADDLLGLYGKTQVLNNDLAIVSAIDIVEL